MSQLAFGLAFSAGAIATVNPCGFAMLPAFVGYYLGSKGELAAQPLWRRAAGGLAVGGSVTAGFLVVFALMGVGLSVGARALLHYVPWASAAVGVGMVLLGLWLLFTRKKLNPRLPRLTTGAGTGPGAMLLFGAAYAVASISCTLPLFVVLLGAALTATGPAGAFFLFLSYGLGMGLVLMAVALGAALFKDLVARAIRPVVPHVERASAALLTAAGLYLIYYQANAGALR